MSGEVWAKRVAIIDETYKAFTMFPIRLKLTNRDHNFSCLYFLVTCVFKMCMRIKQTKKTEVHL